MSDLIRKLEELGYFYTEVDGYLVFSLDRAGGYLEARHLREIADYLDSRNKAWDNALADYLSRTGA